MHLSFSVLLCALAIRLAIASHPIGQLVSDTSPTKPNPFSNVALLPRDERSAPPTLISGLLVRQSRCPSGYGLCSNGFCCPLNSSCCSGDGCCRSGTYCYSTGCCNNGETGCGTTCCPIGAHCCPNGRCCRAGSHCCSGGDCCYDSQYCTVVDGQKGCCPLGEICTRPPPPGPPPTTHPPPPPPPPTTRAPPPPPPPTTRAPPPPPPPTTHAPPPPPPTTHAPPPPPPTTHAPPPPTTGAPPPPTTAPTSSATASNTSISSIPSIPTGGPSSGTNVTVSATDSGIVYMGSWTIISVTCSSIAPAKQCKGPGNSMSYTFTGTAIYLTISQSSNSGVYSVNLDGVTIVLDGYSSSTSACNVSWYRVDLAYTQHTVIINTVGVSSQAPSSSMGTFEFVNFIVSYQSGPSSTVEGSTHSSSSGISSTPTDSGSGSTRNGSPRAAESGAKFLFYASALVYFMLYRL